MIIGVKRARHAAAKSGAAPLLVWRRGHNTVYLHNERSIFFFGCATPRGGLGGGGGGGGGGTCIYHMVLYGPYGP